MCLEIIKLKGESCEPMIAEEDIECFKVLKVGPITGGLFAPYKTQYQYYPNELNHCDDVEAQHAYTYNGKWDNSEDQELDAYEVERAFHSFVDLESAQFEFDHNWDGDFNNYGIFKAIIPKGSRYYKGKYNKRGYTAADDCYASNQLKIIERASA